MRRFAFAFAAALGLAASAGLASGPVPQDYLGGDWRLVAIDGEAFAARATIDFSEPGRVTGTAPCNRWFAGLDSTLPEFLPAEIGATKMACPDLAAEADFFEALASMTRAEVTAPGTLVLTGDKGRSMEFAR